VKLNGETTKDYKQSLWANFPRVRMAVLIPMIVSIIQGLGKLIQILETLFFQYQGARLLPPGFKQVRPG
jgi:hypothetical protein